jgi:hypothetical protein
MTTFLWVVVIAMAAALLAEIFSFIGMAVTMSRAAKNAAEVSNRVKEQLEPARRTIQDLKTFITPRVENITKDGKEIGTLLATRIHTIQAAAVDTSRRAERIHLRLMEGVQTVGETQTRGRGIYHNVAEPIHAATQVLRGLKIALWILRKVA